MALFGKNKDNDGLSDWAKIRDEEDTDSFAAISRSYHAIADYWDESFSSKLNVICMLIVAALIIGGFCFILGYFVPTFDPAR